MTVYNEEEDTCPIDSEESIYGVDDPRLINASKYKLKPQSNTSILKIIFC